MEALIVFGLLGLALALFATEWVGLDVTALIVACALMLTGILSVPEGLSGFSNRATLTIAALFVVSEGIRRTGALNVVAEWFANLGRRSFLLALSGMMLSIGAISAFINNTAAVAIFIPVALSVAARLEVSPTRLLMPLSFVAMLGGVCTLIGTSTNILVSSIAESHDEPPFTMFEFAPLGLVFLAVGFAYMLTVGVRAVPARRRAAGRADDESIHDYLTDIRIESDWEHAGKPIAETPLAELDLEVVRILRDGREIGPRHGRTVVREGDLLRVRGKVETIHQLLESGHVPLPAREYAAGAGGDETLVEAVVAPDSTLEIQSIRGSELEQRFGATVLAVRHHGRTRQFGLENIRLTGGDCLLLAMNRERIGELERDPSFVIVSEVDVPTYRKRHLPVALGIVAGMVAAATSGLVPIVAAALVGALLMVLTGCLTTDEAYRSIHWKVILLLAGIIPLGVAMEKTGAAATLSDSLLGALGDWGPRAVLSGTFLLSMLLTSAISNQATAVLLAPIAIESAVSLGADVRPFLVAVTMAASVSFMTPVGYQTNTLIYGAGRYTFGDFVRVGTPLNLMLWGIASMLIPVLWPL